MKWIVALLSIFAVSASHKKVDTLKLSKQISIKVANGDTAHCKYAANLHFFACAKPLDDSVNTFMVFNALNLSLDKSISLNRTYFDQLMQTNWKNFKGEFALVNTELGSRGATNYKKETRSNIVLQNKKILSIGIQNHYITGATHAHTYHIYGNFNAKTGELLSWKNLITDSALVTEIAQKKYMELQIKKGIPPRVAGYFPNGGFYLSDNYFIDKNSIYFHYNTYEIGTYEEGPTTLEVPLKNLEGALNKEFIRI